MMFDKFNPLTAAVHYVIWLQLLTNKDFVELCRDVDVNITSEVQLLAFISNYTGVDGFQDCNCSIPGQNILTAVNASVPSSTQTNCKPGSIPIKFRLKNESMSTSNVSKPQQKILYEVFAQLQSSHIRQIRNCAKLRPPVLFSIRPAIDNPVRIICGDIIGNSSSRSPPKAISQSTDSTSIATQSMNEPIHSSNSSYLKPALQSTGSTPKGTQIETSTDPDRNTEVTTLKTTSTIKQTSAETSTKDIQHSAAPLNTKVPVIVGAVIGGIFLINITIIVCVLVYRRKLKSSDSNNSTKPPTNEGNEYNDVDEEGNLSYINTVLTDLDIDQRHGNDRIDSVSEGNYASEHEIIDANSERHNHEYEYITDDVNGSRIQNTNRLMNVTDNTYENPNDIGGMKIYMNECVEDTNHQYSTLGQNVDNTGNYEQLIL